MLIVVMMVLAMVALVLDFDVGCRCRGLGFGGGNFRGGSVVSLDGVSGPGSGGSGCCGADGFGRGVRGYISGLDDGVVVFGISRCVVVL